MSTLKVNNIQNASGTNAISIDGSGNVTLAQNLAATTMSGDLTLGANGVYLGGTGSANYLDDYEEGTWTPVMSGISGWLFTTGKYTKIGNMVYAYALFYTNGGVTGSGSNAITGLPFTSNIGEGMCLGTVSRTYGSGMSNANWIVSVNSTTITVTVSGTNDTSLTFSPSGVSRVGISVAYSTDS